MRIDAYNAISQIYGVDKKQSVKSTAKSSTKDKLEISDFGKEMQIAKQAVNASSDVREDKVSDIKAQFAAGTYNVTSSDLADKLLAGYSDEADVNTGDIQ